MPLSPTKPSPCNVFLPICNNFPEQNCLDKSVFNKVCRINHSSLMNNTVTNKVKRFPQLFTRGPKIALKRKWRYCLSWSIITTKVDIYTFISIKIITIARVLFESFSLATTTIWLNFLLKIYPYLHQILML